MTRPEKWNWLHRDADGKPLMAGPNCPDCGRRETIAYRCTACDAQWLVAGVLRWSWQGKAHAFIADEEHEWTKTATEHWRCHGGDCLILPT